MRTSPPSGRTRARSFSWSNTRRSSWSLPRRLEQPARELLQASRQQRGWWQPPSGPFVCGSSSDCPVPRDLVIVPVERHAMSCPRMPSFLRRDVMCHPMAQLLISGARPSLATQETPREALATFRGCSGHPLHHLHWPLPRTGAFASHHGLRRTRERRRTPPSGRQYLREATACPAARSAALGPAVRVALVAVAGRLVALSGAPLRAFLAALLRPCSRPCRLPLSGVFGLSSRACPSLPVLCSAPPGTRTQNLRIKSPLLCHIELEAHRSARDTSRCSSPPHSKRHRMG